MKNPAEIRNIISSPKKHKPQERITNQHIIRYDVSRHSRNVFESLVDKGANGGIAGSDVRLIARMDRVVDVTGKDNHQMVNLPIVTAGGVTKSQRGEMLVILHQYAPIPNGKTIHSILQLEAFKNKVNDRSIIADGGLQCIHIIDGYAIPLNIRNGLPNMQLRPYTDKEWEELQHVVITSDISWDPAVYDSVLTEDDTWYDAIADFTNDDISYDVFDKFGIFKPRAVNAVHITNKTELISNELHLHFNWRSTNKFWTHYCTETTSFKSLQKLSNALLKQLPNE